MGMFGERSWLDRLASLMRSTAYSIRPTESHAPKFLLDGLKLFNNICSVVEQFCRFRPHYEPATTMRSSSFLRLLRHIPATVFTVALAVLSLRAEASAPPTIAPGTLTIGSDLTYPPYAFMNGDKPAGLDPDFMARLAAHLQLKPVFVDTRFANLILSINSKRIDVIASALYVTPERAKQIDFVPYFKTGGSLLALAGGAFKPATPDDLCGKRVASIKGASWIPKLAAVSKDVCAPKGL